MSDYPRNPNTNCLICGKPIYRRPQEIRKNKGHTFCNMVCYGKFSRRERPCLMCNAPIMAHLNKKTCSRACANKHRAGIKYKMNRPHDKVVYQQGLKIRLLNLYGKTCQKCGYSKLEILQVHHKDKKRENNELDNLELLCPNCHFEKHFLEKSWLKEYNSA